MTVRILELIVGIKDDDVVIVLLREIFRKSAFPESTPANYDTVDSYTPWKRPESSFRKIID